MAGTGGSDVGGRRGYGMAGAGGSWEAVGRVVEREEGRVQFFEEERRPVGGDDLHEEDDATMISTVTCTHK